MKEPTLERHKKTISKLKVEEQIQALVPLDVGIIDQKQQCGQKSGIIQQAMYLRKDLSSCSLNLSSTSLK